MKDDRERREVGMDRESRKCEDDSRRRDLRLPRRVKERVNE